MPDGVIDDPARIRVSGNKEPDFLLFLLSLGSSRGSAFRAQVFVKVAGWEYEEQSFACRRRLTTFGAEQQRCVKRTILISQVRSSSCG